MQSPSWVADSGKHTVEVSTCFNMFQLCQSSSGKGTKFPAAAAKTSPLAWLCRRESCCKSHVCHESTGESCNLAIDIEDWGCSCFKCCSQSLAQVEGSALLCLHLLLHPLANSCQPLHNPLRSWSTYRPTAWTFTVSPKTTRSSFGPLHAANRKLRYHIILACWVLLGLIETQSPPIDAWLFPIHYQVRRRPGQWPLDYPSSYLRKNWLLSWDIAWFVGLGIAVIHNCKTMSGCEVNSAGQLACIGWKGISALQGQ